MLFHHFKYFSYICFIYVEPLLIWFQKLIQIQLGYLKHGYFWQGIGHYFYAQGYNILS